MPQVPTMIESGVKGFEITAWFGFLAPAGTPKAIIDKVSADVKKVLAMPEVNKRIVDEATIVVGSTPEEYGAFIKAETAKWKDVIVRTKMTAD
jgi:tripartite-type tricarboxylate transporter receptor subunit TctC